MLGENTCENVHKAIAEEVKNGNELHGLFHSHHEAIAVLQEECEEIEDAFTDFCNIRKKAMPELWGNVKSDDVCWGYCSTSLLDIKSAALDVLFEAVQICAMCDKWLAKIAKEGESNAKDM